MKYDIVRTDTADAMIRRIVFYVVEKFDCETATQKLNELEKAIMMLADDPYIGERPRYPILRKQGYRVLVTQKDLVFYKVDDAKKLVTIYAVVDQRQDYLSIIRGL
ncbi:MAG: type II toxin-antitoxin system RelE/ParE family toxin [Lachnospiraceae bacterium]|nr:type II toxin-antitoxin system RelE/ParE family toxin [Lachnospiraceae bacterium]